MHTSNHYLHWLLPFIYWAIISGIYNSAKILVLKNRLKKSPSNKWLFYVGGTLFAFAVAMFAGYFQAQDQQIVDVGVFILIWAPLMYGLRKGFRMGMYEVEQWDKGVRRI